MASIPASSPAENLSAEIRAALLRLAREAVLAKLAGTPPPAIAAELKAVLPPCGGVFVSLYRHARLRGCVGRIRELPGLAEAVRECAVAAAIEDPRFTPMTPDESDGMRLEISVLSAPVSALPADVLPGRHGLAIERGYHRGVLLPQVATKYQWTRERFLQETCVKAGLPADAWQDPQTRIEIFTAEVFGDSGS